MRHLRYFLLAIVSLTPFGWALGQDVELYVGRSEVNGGRPSVLIILDNSGSMKTDLPTTRPAYDPNVTYPTQGDIRNDRLYWSEDGTPPDPDTNHYFPADSNRCASSQTSLANNGTYTDYFAAWRASWSRRRAREDRWRTVNDSNGTRNTDYVDCKTDVEQANPGNPGTPAQADGYPLNTSAGPYTADAADSNVNWNSVEVRTVYTANYMNWYHNPSLSTTRTRMDVAKDVVKDIIDSNPNVDFGLMVFNPNYDRGPHGGRVIQKVNPDMTDAQRTAMKSLIDGLVADTWTPLCETLYEAYRYYSGEAVLYGDDWSNANPPRDTTAESGGNYISPLGDCQQSYVILMTDGEPTNDTQANGYVDSLPGMTGGTGNRLDELAGWLFSNDLDNDDSNGIQRVVTYTIGFTIDQQLLSDTAEKGGGRYYTADNSAELANAFQGALNEILETSATFTSPSVAVNSFNRSRSLDDVFIAMFKPKVTPRWTGNLKKLTINSDGELVDANGVLAIDSATGDLKDTAQTVWSTAPDGGDVEQGGAGALLAARDPATRTIKTNTGTNGALEDFLTSNTNLTVADFGAADATEKDELINWMRGVDVDDEDEDESTTDTRPWILGDPLHSRPLVLNYGARGSYTQDNPDVRIIMGTNHGVVHMFSSDDGEEDWAFIPKSQLGLIKTLRDNNTSDEHPYGMDGSAVAYMYDSDNDGTISNVNDKVYLFIGQRRGGSAYFALDISNPDSPTFMWKIDDTTAGFSELGQSWSTPVVTFVPGVSDPVLIFGAGYDTNKDTLALATDDSVGRGVFIVNAVTGALVWSVTPAANSATNMQHTGLTHSIPAPVGVLDSNSDGITDRIYAADTGGNLWRIDLPGNTLPSATQQTWSIFKLAAVSGGTDATDRRFFNQPDIVSSRYNNVPFDGIAIGTGNRPHPTETTVSNRFYLIKDFDIVTSYHGTGGTAIPSVITESDLYDATANLIQEGTADEQTTALNSLSTSSGWYLSLAGTGEKSLSPSLTLNGTIYFTTFIPDASVDSCVPVPGTGYLYAVNFHTAVAAFPWDGSDSAMTAADRSVEIGARLPDSVTPHFGEDAIRIIGVGAGEDGKGSYDTGTTLQTNGVYWYRSTQ